MQKAGVDSFYSVKDGATYYYDIPKKAMEKVPGQDAFIILDNIRKSNEVFKNSGVVIEDLGDGILNVEFQSKMNTIGGDVLAGLNKGIDLAEKDFQGLVVGNQAANFSVGANIGMIFMMAVEQEYDELNMAVKDVPGHDDAHALFIYSNNICSSWYVPWWGLRIVSTCR